MIIQIRNHHIIQPKSRKAFGLLEVLFATAVFIVVVGSLVALSNLALRNSALSAHRTQAYNLAQDGIEAVRQLRDTAWLRGNVSGTNDINNWITYPDCANPVTFNTVGVNLVINTDYELCFDTVSLQFGIRPVSVAPLTPLPTDPLSAYIVLGDSNNRPDPSSPTFFKRVVRFESLPNNTQSCPAAAGEGLQLLDKQSNNTVCPLIDIESVHFIKVKVDVSWTEYDKNWSVSLSTILTNWRRR